MLVIFHLPFQVHPPTYSARMDSITQAPLPSDYYVGHPGKHQRHNRIGEEGIVQSISPTPSSVSAHGSSSNCTLHNTNAIQVCSRLSPASGNTFPYPCTPEDGHSFLLPSSPSLICSVLPTPLLISPSLDYLQNPSSGALFPDGTLAIRNLQEKSDGPV